MAEKGKELRNLDIAGVTPHLILLGIHSKMALRSLCQPMLRVRETTAGIALPTSLPKKMKVPGRGGKTAGAIHEGLPGSFKKSEIKQEIDTTSLLRLGGQDRIGGNMTQTKYVYLKTRPREYNANAEIHEMIV